MGREDVAVVCQYMDAIGAIGAYGLQDTGQGSVYPL